MAVFFEFKLTSEWPNDENALIISKTDKSLLLLTKRVIAFVFGASGPEKFLKFFF